MDSNNNNIHKRDPGKTLEVLYEISSAITNTRNLDELYRVIHTSLDKILDVKNFYIALLNEQSDSITFPYHVDEMDEDPEEIFDFSKQPSLTGLVINEKKPHILYRDDIINLARKLNKEIIGTLTQVWLGAPLKIKDKVIGAIAIQNYETQSAYNKGDLDLLNSVSQHIALAIERKESEKKLESQRKVMEKILESSPVGIALVENRVFKWVNNEMIKLFGYTDKADFNNKSVRMIYASDEDYERSGSHIYSSFTTTGKADYEFKLMKKNGDYFPVHIRLNCDDPGDPMKKTIATFTDISERKAAEKERMERERLQGVLEMAGAVCHELNQPLQAILGYSELMLMDGSGGRIDNNLHSIVNQATRIGNITKKLSTITYYKTVDYPGNTKIVDIWGTEDR